MTATTRSVELLRLRFPRLGRRVALLYHQHETVRGLCDAYAICERGVRRCEASRSLDLRAEYEALQRRFETGLRERLERAGEESQARS